MGKEELSSLLGHVKKEIRAAINNVTDIPLSKAVAPHSASDELGKQVKNLHRYALHPAVVSDAVRYGGSRYYAT